MRWIGRLDQAPIGLVEPLVWVLRLDGAEAQAAGVLAADLADAAALGPIRGAERLIRRRLTRALVGRALGVHPDVVDIARDSAGAPRIVAPELLFLSHAGRAGLLAIGVAREPVGVDLEMAKPQPPLPLDLLHPSEREWLVALPPLERARAFARVWVAKEALAKASGRGLDAVLASDPVREELDGGLKVGDEVAEFRALGGLVAAALTLRGGSSPSS